MALSLVARAARRRLTGSQPLKASRKRLIQLLGSGLSQQRIKGVVAGGLVGVGIASAAQRRLEKKKNTLAGFRRANPNASRLSTSAQRSIRSADAAVRAVKPVGTPLRGAAKRRLRDRRLG